MMMNQSDAWMTGDTWTWSVTGALLVVVLLMAIKTLSKK